MPTLSDHIHAHCKKPIRLLVCDVDGVLTDGKIYIGQDGKEVFKVFHAHDGLGLVNLLKSGVQVALLTARSSDILVARAHELGIQHIIQGAKEKRGALEALLNTLQIDASQTAYVGDDLPDIPAMQKVALPVAVGNATQAVKDIAHWICAQPGGHGAVREICDALLSGNP